MIYGQPSDGNIFHRGNIIDVVSLQKKQLSGIVNQISTKWGNVMTPAEEKRPLLIKSPAYLDAAGGMMFQQKVAAIVPESYNLWVVDLGSVDFVDSAGLLALVSCLRLAREQGCDLVVCNLKATVRLLFEITQLDRIFQVFDSYEAVCSNLVKDGEMCTNLALVAA